MAKALVVMIKRALMLSLFSFPLVFTFAFQSFALSTNIGFTVETGHGNTGFTILTHDVALALTAFEAAETVWQTYRTPGGGFRNAIADSGQSSIAFPEFIFRVQTSHGETSIGIHAQDISSAYSALAAAIAVLKSEGVAMGQLESINSSDATTIPDLPQFTVTLKTGHGSSGFVVPGKSAEDVELVVRIAAKVMRVGGGLNGVEVSKSTTCAL